MAVRQTLTLFKYSYVVPRLHFSTSSSVNNKWRLKKNLEPNPNRYGPMNLYPDYSYVDGRPVPLSSRKIKEMEYQQKLCQRIVELSNELDVGLEEYHKRMEQRAKKRTAIIQNKLKPKGAALLKKNKKDSK